VFYSYILHNKYTFIMEDLTLPNNSTQRSNNQLLPNSMRACIIGKSGCGKTNLLMNLLLNDYLDYNHLHLFGKSLHQPEYQTLIKSLRNNIPKHLILDLMKSKLNNYVDKIGMGVGNIIVEYDPNRIPDPKDLNIKHKNLVVFDDLMLEKQNKYEDYYTRGRHNNVDCIYISQNYTKLPRQTIRENSNLFLLFPQDNITLDHFYRDHVSDLSKNDFKFLCRETWSEPYNFVTIDLTSRPNYGRYRRNLDEFLVI